MVLQRSWLFILRQSPVKEAVVGFQVHQEEPRGPGAVVGRAQTQNASLLDEVHPCDPEFLSSDLLHSQLAVPSLVTELDHS